MHALRIDRSEIDASIYDSSGRLVDGPGSTGGDALVLAALRGTEATATTSDTIVVAAPVSDGDRVSAVVVLRAGLDPAHHRGVLAGLLIAAIGAGAVLIAARPLGWWQDGCRRRSSVCAPAPRRWVRAIWMPASRRPA